MSKTLTCKKCEKTRPEDDFQKNRWGRTKVCRECRKSKSSQTKPKDTKKPEAEPLDLDPNSAGYDEVMHADEEGDGELFDERTFRVEVKGVGKIRTAKISSRQWIARQPTYYPGMKDARYTIEEVKKMNPFDENYDWFWSEGYGRSEQAAIRAMREDLKRTRRGE